MQQTHIISGGIYVLHRS